MTHKIAFPTYGHLHRVLPNRRPRLLVHLEPDGTAMADRRGGASLRSDGCVSDMRAAGLGAGRYDRRFIGRP